MCVSYAKVCAFYVHVLYLRLDAANTMCILQYVYNVWQCE